MEQTKTAKLEKSLIQHCSLVFHSYFSRDMDTFISLLDKDFVWIGSYEFQFTRGIEEFLKITENEQNELSAEVYDEEYHVLSRDQNTWIVYGCFSASAWKDEATFLYTRQRATYVWKFIQGQFKLLHLHCTMARDVPLTSNVDIDVKQQIGLRWYDYMLHAEETHCKEKQHFLLKDANGGIHYLYPTEILYISISYRTATVYTTAGNFEIHQKLSQLLELMPFLIQAHKSWLVNPIYVTEIKRYHITLANKTEIPVGKSRYDEVRAALAHH